MKKPTFLLKESRDLLISKNATANHISNRRSFLKTLGLTALAANPALGAVKKLSESPFTIEHDSNWLKVWRKGILAWEISPKQFAPFTKVFIESKPNGWDFRINNFNLKNTLLQFNLSGHLTENLGHWVLKMESPEIHLSGETDFNDFLDGVKPLATTTLLNNTIITLPNGGKIWLEGEYQTSIEPDWSLQFSKKSGVNMHVLETDFNSHSLKIIPGLYGKLPFYEGDLKGSILELNAFTDWNKFISSYSYRGKKQLRISVYKSYITNSIRKQ